MSEDNKGGLQIRGESGFGKEGKEGLSDNGKGENHREVTETEARENEIQRRAPFQPVVKSKAILWWGVLSCFVRLLRCVPQQANLPRVTSKRLPMQMQES